MILAPALAERWSLEFDSALNFFLLTMMVFWLMSSSSVDLVEVVADSGQDCMTYADDNDEVVGDIPYDVGEASDMVHVEALCRKNDCGGALASSDTCDEAGVDREPLPCYKKAYLMISWPLFLV